MASKNLGAVIQRAISDGAFRRQLQSDPAAALRGFNLTPDEVAAIRSGDSGKLMSLGVDQRMSKAFSVFGATDGGSVRSTLADGTASAGSNAIIDGGSAGLREGISGDPSVGSRSAFDPVSGVGREAISTGDTASSSDAHSLGSTSGTRALHEEAPSDSGMMLNDPTAAQTRAIHNTEPSVAGLMADTNLADGTRALHNVEPTDLGSSQVAATNDFSGGDIHQDAGDVTGGSGNALRETDGETPGADGTPHSWG